MGRSRRTVLRRHHVLVPNLICCLGITVVLFHEVAVVFTGGPHVSERKLGAGLSDNAVRVSTTRGGALG